MGANAVLVAVGKYNPDYHKHFDLPHITPGELPAGTELAVIVFEEYGGTSLVREFADALGFDLYDASRYHVDVDAVNTEQLTRLFDSDSVDDFLALKAAGCEFYFIIGT